MGHQHCPQNLDNNQALLLKNLTLKKAMLLALTRPSRSVDLHSLDTQLIRSNPEGISFRSSIPPKQTKAAKIGQDFFSLPGLNLKLSPDYDGNSYGRTEQISTVDFIYQTSQSSVISHDS